MKAILLRVIAAIAVPASLLYAGDYVVLRSRIAYNREPFGTVMVEPEYVIQEKNGKVEYQFAQPQPQTCVHSLFPHLGYNPCWYVKRHTEQRIEI